MSALYVKPTFKVTGVAAECSFTARSTTSVTCPLKSQVEHPSACYATSSLKKSDAPMCPLRLQRAEQSVPTWKAYVVINAIIITIVATILGGNVVLLMMMTSTLFVFCGITSEEEAFQGFGSNSMIALAILFVLSKAVEWSGLFDIVIFSILGGAQTVRGAQLRLLPATALLATFVNNTPLVAMMLPMIISWAKQRDVDAMKLALPVAYAGGLGGIFSKIGSSTNLVAADYNYDPRLNMDMGFFDLAPVALILVIVCIAYVIIFTPTLLRASVQPRSSYNLHVEERNLYLVPWVVMEDSELVGKSWRARGLHRMPKTRLVSGPCFEASVSVGDTHALLHQQPREDHIVKAGHRLVICTDAEGVGALRRIYGLAIAGEAGVALRQRGDSKLRQRRLFEAVLANKEFEDLQQWALLQHEAALIACRGQGLDRCSVRGQTQILLLDAKETFEMSAAPDFSLVRLVKNSAPIRAGRRSDTWRACSSLVLFGLVVSLSALGLKRDDGLPLMPLASLCLWASAALIGLDVLRPEEALASINANALLSLCAAFGMGKGLQNSGVADGLANGLISLCKAMGLGATGLCGGFFMTAGLLSNLMSNTATTLMMLPIAESVALQEGVPIKTLVFVLLYGANCVFATPIGTSTNMIVQQPAGPDERSYSFGDYLRFGTPLQCIMLFVCVPFTLLFYGSGPS